jgi:hypothetical protein
MRIFALALVFLGALTSSIVAQSVGAIPGWQEIAPAGAVCSDGSPWKFYVATGDPKKVVVDFQGGGACWDEASCNPQANLFTRTVQAEELEYAQGIYNRASSANPFKGWSHVFVPYCTGDIHWGNVTRQYGNLKIEHQGAVNAKAALDYVYKNYTNPSNVFVTGCSAGAYGSVIWAPYLMRQYPNARVAQLGDSGLGVIRPEFNKVVTNAWQAGGAVPDFIPELAAARADATRIRLEELYKAIGKAFPKNSLSQFTYNTDAVQIFFYALGKGETSPSQTSAVEWVQNAMSGLAVIKAATPNYANFVGPGEDHCIIPTPAFYTLRVNNVPFTQGVNELITKTPADAISLPR